MPCFLANGGGQRDLFGFALSPLPSIQDNPYAQMACFGVAFSFFFFFFFTFYL